MTNDIRRKHFRFPAFDDESGVKIQKEERVLFGGEDDILTTHDVEEDIEKYIRRTRKSTAKKAGQSLKQRENLEHHRQNLPNYDKHRSFSNDSAQPKRNLFEEKNKEETKSNETRKIVKTKKSVPTIERPQQVRSFKPKYIPASVIPDDDKNAVTQEELYRAMYKPGPDYLLFDTGYKPYQDEAEQVNKFPEESIAQLLDAEPETPKKNARLERSLKGIMSESQQTLEKTKYFDQSEN